MDEKSIHGFITLVYKASATLDIIREKFKKKNIWDEEDWCGSPAFVCSDSGHQPKYQMENTAYGIRKKYNINPLMLHIKDVPPTICRFEPLGSSCCLTAAVFFLSLAMYTDTMEWIHERTPTPKC